jgi:signal transduction histidine kinase
MADRIEALAGKFSVTSSAQDGTAVHADIPMPVPQKLT